MNVRKKGILNLNHATQKIPVYKMPKDMQLGAPLLRVRSLREALEFYGDAGLGLTMVRRSTDPVDTLEMVELGFSPESSTLIKLKSDPAANPPPQNSAGLYHYAVLLPDRKSLASTYLGIGNKGVLFEGFADHTFSEALYLHDTEENGIEIYADRKRESWSPYLDLMREGDAHTLMSMNKPLDFLSLLRELDKTERDAPVRFPRGGRIGHMHLRVTDLQRSVQFYHEKLGLDIVANLPEIGAAFLSVGGYHHHLGLNTWHSAGGVARQRKEAGLESFEIRLPDRAKLIELRELQFPDLPLEKGGTLQLSDPDGIRIMLRSPEE